MCSTLVRQLSQNCAKFIQHVQQKFFNYRFKVETNISSDVTTLETIVFELKELGVIISEVTLITKILGTLTRHFSSVRAAWDNLDKSRQTLATFFGFLMQASTQGVFNALWLVLVRPTFRQTKACGSQNVRSRNGAR